MTQQSEKYTPSSAVAKNAQKGLDLHNKFKRGGTAVGVTRAHQLSKREHIDISIIKRMTSYFARHSVDKNTENFGNDDDPSKGYIAWLLWGGDEGQKWADEIKQEYQKSTQKTGK